MDQSLTDLPVMSVDLPVMTAGHVFGLDYDAPLFCFGKPALHALTTFLVPIMYGQFCFFSAFCLVQSYILLNIKRIFFR
jgi:hypothetical protein